MTVYVILVFTESYIEEEFATLEDGKADEKFEEFCEKYKIDPDTGSNGDESITLHYLTFIL